MTNDLEQLTYASTHRFQPIALDYLAGAEALREHQQFPFTPDGLEQAARERQFPAASRQVLTAALQRQYTGLDLQEDVKKNLAALAKEGTLTITTGHQLCLFSGPLYVPLKIMNTVRMARDLQQRVGKPVVPMFWMATEDHDRAEIDHAWVFGKKLEWKGGTAGAVGRMKLDGIEAVLAELDPLLGPGVNADVLRSTLRASYREGYTLAQATRLLVNSLFGRYGVVCIDGDDPALKQLFAPVLQEELLNQVTHRTVRYANDKLATHYPEQAHVREINLFMLGEGTRSRIEADGDRFKPMGEERTFSMDELLGLAQHAPEVFSPNVLLRPVYQETVLPNVAYVGGGGEIAYWLQLRWLFQGLRVPMPVMALRTSAMFLHATDRERLGQLGLSMADLFRPMDQVSAELAARLSTIDADLAPERHALNELFEALALRAKAADATLEGSVRSEAQKAMKGIEAIEGKLLRAAKREQELVLQRFAKIHNRLFPDGGLQERRDNFIPFYLEHGPAFFDRLLELDPFEMKFSAI
ncbi:MAG: bacillithiol biosynthesis cysteine-adding enzyme BshC [Flavobacteriales bacterium]